jgi:hypothetical protein
MMMKWPLLPVFVGSAVVVALLIEVDAPGMASRPSLIVAIVWCSLAYGSYLRYSAARRALLGWDLLAMLAIGLTPGAMKYWGIAIFECLVVLQILCLGMQEIRVQRGRT